MATRMQQRRGTAAQWISTNNGDGPTLQVGEIGFETDTGKFKIGDGVNPWVDLDYFLDESDITGITGDYVLANTLGQANGVATLDGSGKLTGSQIPGIDELAQDAVDLALVAGTGLTKTYNDNANTITIAVDTSVIATKAELAEVSQDSINDALTAGTGITKSYDDNANTITLAVNTSVIQERVAGVSDTEIGYLANVTSDIQTQINSKASSTDLSNHESDTSNIHGIADTAELATKEFAANLLVNASKTNITITGNKDGLTITAENGVADSNTDNLVEGSTNLYFTNARAQAAVASDISSAINALSTTDIEEGTNLYFTAERAQDSVGNVVGTGLVYDDNTGAISTNNIPNASLANSAVTINGFSISLGGSASYSSDNIGEGTENLYFTNARARATVSGGTGLDYNTSTGVFDIDSTVTTNTGNQTLTNKSIDLANNTVTGTVAQFNSALSDANFITTTDTGTVTSTMLADETIVNADIANNAAIAQSKIDGLTTDLAAKASLSGAAFTGNVSTTANLTVDGNFIVNGSNVLVSATQIQIEDSIIQIAHENPANTVDLGLVAGYNDGTAKHAGLVKDATDGKWKLFDGVTDEPATTVNFAQASYDDLVVGGLEASSLTVGDVSNTEFGYLANVTSDIQTQLNSKASSTDLSNHESDTTNIHGIANTAVIVFTTDTGTVTSTMLADETIVNADIANNAAIAQSKIANLTTDLANKQDKVSGVSDTEIGYLDGVTSNVQAQIDGKISSSSSDTLTSKSINLANNTVTGTIAQFNTALSDADFATLAGAETLSNKTLANATVTGTITAGGGVGTNGQFLQSTASGVQWATVSSPVTTGTVSIDSSPIIDTLALSSFTSAEYTLSLKQGTKVRTSKVFVQTDGSTVDMSEFGITETGGEITSVAVTASVSGSNAVLNVSPQLTQGSWVSQNSSFGSFINTAKYLNGLWVAVGNNGAIATSTDAVTWTQQTSPFSGRVYDVAYGNGVWLAVGDNGEAATSTDAINWVSRTTGFGSTRIWTVAYGNGKFIAGGNSGLLRSTTDGITWTTVTSGYESTFDGIRSVIFANNSWLIGTNTGKMKSSTDGISWTTRSITIDSIYSLGYGNGVFVAAGGLGELQTSTDTVTWTPRTSNISGNINSVAYGSNIWVAVGNAAELSVSTNNGETWSTQTSNFSSHIYSAAYNNNKFVIAGNLGELRTSDISGGGTVKFSKVVL